MPASVRGYIRSWLVWKKVIDTEFDLREEAIPLFERKRGVCSSKSRYEVIFERLNASLCRVSTMLSGRAVLSRNDFSSEELFHCCGQHPIVLTLQSEAFKRSNITSYRLLLLQTPRFRSNNGIASSRRSNSVSITFFHTSQLLIYPRTEAVFSSETEVNSTILVINIRMIKVFGNLFNEEPN